MLLINNKQKLQNTSQNVIKFLVYRVYAIGFSVQGLEIGIGFMVYKAFVNSFNKHLNKSYKAIFKML